MHSLLLRRLSKTAVLLLGLMLALFAGAGLGIPKALADIVDAAPPVIPAFERHEFTAQPGRKLHILITATGDSLSYQWYSNSENSTEGGKPVDGATTDELVLNTWAPGSTYYYCVVTNTNNNVNGNKTASATSDILKITVPLVDAAPPVIRAFEGHELTIQPGIKLYITIHATGDSLSYQWYSNTENSTEGGKPVDGATTDELVLNTWAPGSTYYYCVVTNTNNNVNGNKTASATSDILKITVPLIDAAAPVIKPIPASGYSIKPGWKLIFKLSSTGDSLSYQWYSNTKRSTTGGKKIDGATSAELTVYYTTKPETVYYYCVVTNTNNSANGNQTASATSDILKVTMLVPAEMPTVSSPFSTAAVTGSTAAFWVKASSPDGGILSYQWQKSADGGVTWRDISGATGSSYMTGKLSRADNGIQYRCLVSNSRNYTTATATSTAATLTVTAHPTLMTILCELRALLYRCLNLLHS